MENLNKVTQTSTLSAQPSTEEINKKIETVVPDSEKEVLPIDDKNEKIPSDEIEDTSDSSESEEHKEESSEGKDNSPADDIETVSP